MGFSILLKQRERKKEELRRKALKEAKKLSFALAEVFSYEKLYLFGSVLKKQTFTPHSDLDFIIKGLDENLFLKAYAFLLKKSSFSVDLKPWESLKDSIKKKIEKEGMLLCQLPRNKFRGLQSGSRG